MSACRVTAKRSNSAMSAFGRSKRPPASSRLPHEGMNMNDSEKPETPSAAPLAEEAAPRPQPKLGPPPALEPEQVSGPGPRLKELDAAIERELQEAMSGLSDKELYGEPAQQRGKPPAGSDQGRKKARVVAVHGNDVFLDVPGGRSQGVLSMVQFPEGAPAVGSEVEIHIEGYDAANGLLLLSRLGAAVHADWSSVAAGMLVEARITA